jgi:serine/threonine protein kinase
MNERDVFVAALKKSNTAERAAFLDEACAGDATLRQQVETLLREHDQLGGFLESPAAATIDAPPPAERPGTVIGPYKLLQQIGEGGMGTVFMAEQTQPVKRKVALKVIKPGMDSRQVIARFEAERQALAMMDHVNIARVFDGGATETGRPYFVMELVHGVPITKYCDDNQLTPRQRLELFVPVCQAIQHAHQKGIIHRDVKPSNVMVTLYDGKPAPKVIDFGVAKATEQKLTERTLFTQYGTMVGTLEYMSPEQAEMSALGVDTRSDIYSLGVLLYELLTGSTPLTRKRFKDAAYGEILRMIKEEEPPKPSTRLSDSGEALASISAQRKTEPAKLAKLVRGELDWIVMKTLEKDRNRRYDTASAFAADVQRYLDDESVLACPPSAWYKFRKFSRRNKATLATVTALAVAVLLAVGSLVSAVLVLVVSNRQSKEGQERTQTALIVADDQRSRAEENLKLALQALDEIFIKRAEEEVGAKQREGKLPLGPEQLERVDRKILQKGLSFYERFVQANSTNLLLQGEMGKAYQRAGYLHQLLGQNDKAEIAMRKSIAILERLAQEFPESPEYRRTLVNNYYWLGHVLKATGRREEAETIWCHNLAVTKQLVADFPTVEDYRGHLSASCYALGSLLQERGKFTEAAGVYRDGAENWEKFKRTDANGLYDAAAWRALTAAAIRASGKSPRAGQQAGDQAMAWLKQAVAAGFTDVSLIRWDKDLDDLRDRADFGKLMAEMFGSPGVGPGIVHAERGEWDMAVAEYAQSFEKKPPSDPYVWFEFACLRVQVNDAAGYHKLCSRMRERFGDSQDVEEVALLAHACVLAPGGAGDATAAIRLAERRLILTLPPSHHYGWSVHLMGLAYYRAGQDQKAIEWLSKELQVDPDFRLPAGQLEVRAWLVLAMAHDRLGHAGEARKWLDKAEQWLNQKTRDQLDKGARFAPPGWPWRDWLLVQLSRREAVQMLKK